MDLSRKVFDDVSQLIGSRENPTPLVRLRRLVPAGSGEIFAKLEWMNPFGSIKDRTAKHLIEGLLRRDRLAGKKIVEPTSGNTGIALAALSNLACVPCTITIPSGGEPRRKRSRSCGSSARRSGPLPTTFAPSTTPRTGPSPSRGPS